MGDAQTDLAHGATSPTIFPFSTHFVFSALLFVLCVNFDCCCRVRPAAMSMPVAPLANRLLALCRRTVSRFCFLLLFRIGQDFLVWRRSLLYLICIAMKMILFYPILRVLSIEISKINITLFVLACHKQQ
jgi:hypothetical protein